MRVLREMSGDPVRFWEWRSWLAWRETEGWKWFKKGVYNGFSKDLLRRTLKLTSSQRQLLSALEYLGSRFLPS